MSVPALSNRFQFFFRLARVAACAAALMLLLSGVSVAEPANEYRLVPGDTIEFTTAATSDLKTRATIRLDGAVTLPLVGDVKVAGLSLPELRAKLQDKMASKVYRRRNQDGREVPVMIAPDEIIVTVAEYRPIYVNGDVSKPGEQTFRPGMTVRQAIALAGGYDIMHFRMNNPFLEEADIRGEYNALWTQYAESQARILRLQAELENAQTFNRKALDETPIPSSVAKRINDVEAGQLAVRNALFEKNKDYLEDAIKKENERIAVLGQQQQKEKEGQDSDSAELARVQGLFEKQTLPITRVIEARRTILFSSTRYLQTIVEKGRAERGRDELVSKLDKLDEERRKTVLADLQDAQVKLAITRSRLQAVGDKLRYTGLVRSQLVRGQGSEPEVNIFRGGAKPIAANQETELRPGDVVDVALQKNMFRDEHMSAFDEGQKQNDARR
jgi:polysaccharide export outer membrane protein